MRKPMAGAFFFFWLWYATDTKYNVGRGTLKIGRFDGSGLSKGRTASPETLRKIRRVWSKGASAGASASARAVELCLLDDGYGTEAEWCPQYVNSERDGGSPVEAPSRGDSWMIRIRNGSGVTPAICEQWSERGGGGGRASREMGAARVREGSGGSRAHTRCSSAAVAVAQVVGVEPINGAAPVPLTPHRWLE